jgi:hypothetical protein
MCDTFVGAGAGAASCYGSGSDQKRRLRLRNTADKIGSQERWQPSIWEQSLYMMYEGFRQSIYSSNAYGGDESIFLHSKWGGGGGSFNPPLMSTK